MTHSSTAGSRQGSYSPVHVGGGGEHLSVVCSADVRWAGSGEAEAEILGFCLIRMTR